jgi:hypothetical protein
MVEIQEARVEPMSTLPLDTFFNEHQPGTPGRSSLARPRVRIRKGGISHPRNLAGEDPTLAENHDFILLPGSRGQQLVEKILRLSATEEGWSVLHHPISVQKRAIALVEKRCLIPVQDLFER